MRDMEHSLDVNVPIRELGGVEVGNRRHGDVRAEVVVLPDVRALVALVHVVEEGRLAWRTQSYEQIERRVS